MITEKIADPRENVSVDLMSAIKKEHENLFSW